MPKKPKRNHAIKAHHSSRGPEVKVMAGHPQRGANFRSIKAIRDYAKQACKLSAQDYVEQVAPLPQYDNRSERFRQAVLASLHKAVILVTFLHLRAIGFNRDHAKSLAKEVNDDFWERHDGLGDT